MSQQQQPPDAPGSGGTPVQWGAVLGGAILGWLGTWFLIAVVVISQLASYTDGGATGTAETVANVVAFAAVPVISVAVLLFRRARGQFVAGTLLGVAIGSIIGAGVCGSVALGG
jgi:hypothetical protein